MESAGSFNCERFDCPRDMGDCSRCERPHLTREVTAVLTLYRRCRQWRTLPFDGGIMAQDERLMGLIDFVDNQVEHWKAKKLEDDRNEMTKQTMVNQMKGRHA